MLQNEIPQDLAYFPCSIRIAIMGITSVIVRANIIFGCQQISILSLVPVNKNKINNKNPSCKFLPVSVDFVHPILEY